MLKKKLLKTAFALGGFSPLHSLTRRKILILTYHRFSTESHPLKISADEFRSHLAYLRKQATVLGLLEIIDMIREGEKLPPNSTVITIDDGYHDAYEVAYPILNEFCFPATLFAVTGFVDQRAWIWTDLMRFVLLSAEAIGKSFKFQDKAYNFSGRDRNSKLLLAGELNSRLKQVRSSQRDDLIHEIADQLTVAIPPLPTRDYAPATLSQLRDMDRNGLRVESHSETHPILTKIDKDHLDKELRESKQFLERELGREMHLFCYPNGSVNSEVRDAVARNGYTAAVSTEFGFNDEGTDPFMLRRIDAPASIESFAQYTSGFESIKQRIRQSSVFGSGPRN